MLFDWVFVYAVPFMVILTAIVFVHELGHYLLAKYNGVKVEVFSIGFGPEVFGFNDKSGTRWKFSYIPLGGYVRMFSDVDASSRPDMEALSKLTEEEKSYSHHYKTVWQRIQISIAGPAANYIFGILLLAILYSTSGQRVPMPVVGLVEQNSVAATAGLEHGDRILQIDQTKISDFKQIEKIINAHPNVPLTLEIERNGETMTKQVTPQPFSTVNEEGKTVEVGRIGFVPAIESIQKSPLAALGLAATDAVVLTGKTLYSLFEMILGKKSPGELSGPIGIAMATGKIATTDIPSFFWFMAFLSLNLGLVNILPIPVLDGGHLLYYFIEAIRGKPLSERAQEIGFKIGLAIILALLVFTTFKDLGRISIFQKLMNIFS